MPQLSYDLGSRLSKGYIVHFSISILYLCKIRKVWGNGFDVRGKSNCGGRRGVTMKWSHKSIVNWTHRNKLQRNFNQNTKLFIRKKNVGVLQLNPNPWSICCVYCEANGWTDRYGNINSELDMLFRIHLFIYLFIDFFSGGICYGRLYIQLLKICDELKCDWQTCVGAKWSIQSI